jgi:hypothetical protein
VCGLRVLRVPVCSQAAAKAAAEADAAKKAEEEAAASAVASARANSVSSPSTAVRSESELTGASKVLEDKLLKLKGQLHDLRSSIKGFEEDFDRRLDQCLAEILGSAPDN